MKATPPDAIPASALAVLHSYEDQSSPAPMKTYTSVITKLFSIPSSMARAHAWDLFTHMRYAAHPTPDAVLYTLMVRACASPISSRSSEPERALDLWTEMTVEQKIEPTVGTYSAVILACARAGSKTYVNEAFRLAKSMLDSHRDAYGHSAFRPDRRTFCALLEGAKRIGDLARARWILAEMVRGSRRKDEDDAVDAEINEEVMMHMFHAYSAYDPPFKREIALLVDESPTQVFDGEAEGNLSGRKSSSRSIQDPSTTEKFSSFGHIPPQSRSEVISEATSLFLRILEDKGLDRTGKPLPPHALFSGPRKFQHVELTTRLLNSYISVYYRHSSLEVAQELFWTLFDDLAVKRSPRSYLEALERCTLAKRGPDRSLALRFAERLMGEWQALEDSSTAPDSRPLHSRIIERAHIAFIRILSL